MQPWVWNYWLEVGYLSPVQFLELIVEGENSYLLSSELHTHAIVCMCTHTHTRVEMASIIVIVFSILNSISLGFYSDF